MDSSASLTLGIVRTRVKPLEWSDLDGADWLRPRAIDSLRAVSGSSRAWTGWTGDKLVAVFGYTMSYPHVAHVWSYLHPSVVSYPHTLCRVGSRLLTALRHMHRVEATAREDYPGHGAWLEWLGFQVESLMPYAGPNGVTMVRYVWFPQEIR